MNRKYSRILLTACLVILAGLTMPLAQEQPAAPPPATPAQEAAPKEAAPPAPVAPMVESIKVIVDDKAKADGEIRFVVTPEGAEAKTIRVTVLKGMGKKDVCRDIAKELAVGLGQKYTVDQYDDDKVKISGKDKAKFSLTLSAQSVTGLSVKIE